MSLNICGHGRRNFEKVGGMARLCGFGHNNVEKFWINRLIICSENRLLSGKKGFFQKYVQKNSKNRVREREQQDVLDSGPLAPPSPQGPIYE